ncbi:hypothetical protein HF685_11960 [Parasphingorhabdus halotolerans]|uniref:Uncharacterized protein n=1 Tax=Parasphingorhabdus halotolerans TaxID=2725558 RepID=A0A6H2DQ74_9SPHN|nr:hypothetical protein HF685_11960 [Parasphingorhabdus halotolerans]
MLQRLERYRPDIVTIEAVSGGECWLLRQYPSEYPGVAKDYCFDAREYQVESGLTDSDAVAEIRHILSQWPAKPAASQRRHLAAAFVAAGDPYSALVQWFQLAEAEKRAADGLGERSATFLNELSERPNESAQIEARLAAKLRHVRVYAIDNHSSDAIFANFDEGFWDRMQEIWRSEPVPDQSEMRSVEEDIRSEGGVLRAFRFYNSAKAQSFAMDYDFRKAMNDALPEGYGRKYVAWFQARNLRMVASIVEAAATKPGGKVLSIVGASHKPYFEAYLDQMHDFKIVNIDAFLE